MFAGMWLDACAVEPLRLWHHVAWSWVMSAEPIVWESFAFKTGAEAYVFEVRDKGLIGALSVSDGRKFALPLVVWEALFDAVKTNRRAKLKAEENLPPRAGARWTGTEIDELEAKFRSGRSIEDLAREHARTVWAIEGQLAKMGLWDRLERRRVA
jgi:hypothetical protein